MRQRPSDSRQPLKRNLRAEGECAEVLADVGIVQHAMAEPGRNGADPTDLVLLPLQRELEGRVRIPVERRGEDALIAAANTASRNRVPQKSGMIVEIKVAIARGDFPCP